MASESQMKESEPAIGVGSVKQIDDGIVCLTGVGSEVR